MKKWSGFKIPFLIHMTFGDPVPGRFTSWFPYSCAADMSLLFTPINWILKRTLNFLQYTFRTVLSFLSSHICGTTFTYAGHKFESRLYFTQLNSYCHFQTPILKDLNVREL